MAVYVAIIAATLVVLDLVLIVFDIAPPHYQRGHPQLGWVTGLPTGKVDTAWCIENSTGDTLRFIRNEDGIRSEYPATRLQADTALFTVAATGDSQTDLCAPNGQVHFGVVESELRRQGVPAAVFAYGAGKYSPLQAYLAVKEPIERYHADALILNIYVGNDFYDMLRVDDRPHFVPEAGGYRIGSPIWYQEYPPDERYRSRVMYVMRSLAQRTGIRNVWVRIAYLRDVARERGRSFASVVRYMNDLRNSTSDEIGYSAAFSAQMLNQQLFFHHFPGSKEESVERIRFLLRTIRVNHPGVRLYLSPIPSYELVRQQPVDTALLKVVSRLPVSYAQGVREEGELYERLRGMAQENGWTFVDPLPALRSYTGQKRLYNDFDYHLLPVGSEIVGRAQAQVIMESLRSAASKTVAPRP